MKNIILIGFQGVGKSYLGKKFANHFNMVFLDTDRLIEEYFLYKFSIRQIYDYHGEKKFREIEKRVILGLQDFCNTVIATGGGVVEIPGIKKYLRNLGKVIYVYDNLEVLKGRCKKKPTFFRGCSFEEVFFRRHVLYSDVCEKKVMSNWDQILLEDNLR